MRTTVSSPSRSTTSACPSIVPAPGATTASASDLTPRVRRATAASVDRAHRPRRGRRARAAEAGRAQVPRHLRSRQHRARRRAARLFKACNWCASSISATKWRWPARQRHAWQIPRSRPSSPRSVARGHPPGVRRIAGRRIQRRRRVSPLRRRDVARGEGYNMQPGPRPGQGVLAAAYRTGASSLVHVPVYDGPDPTAAMGAYGAWNVGDWFRDIRGGLPPPYGLIAQDRLLPAGRAERPSPRSAGCGRVGPRGIRDRLRSDLAAQGLQRQHGRTADQPALRVVLPIP